MIKTLLLITAFVQVIPLIIGILYFKRLSFIEAKAFLLYLGISIITEIIAHYYASLHQNNLFIYNISDALLALFISLVIWKKSVFISKVLSIFFLICMTTAFLWNGIINYDPYANLILYGTIVCVSLVQLRKVISKQIGNAQQMWFYMAFLAKGVLCINLYYLYYYLLEIRSQVILPYYISFNFASSIVFAVLLSISFLCQNQKNIS